MAINYVGKQDKSYLRRSLDLDLLRFLLYLSLLRLRLRDGQRERPILLIEMSP